MKRTRMLVATLIALLIASFAFSLIGTNVVNAASPNLFYPKDTLTQMFMNLYNQYPSIAHYQSVGNTYNGHPIWLFTIGNPNGGRVLWDGSMHGWEDIGSLLEYYYATWLLTSGDPEAQRIIANNYIMFVPIVNFDGMNQYGSCTRQNGDYSRSQYGVDLNRNFVSGWAWSDPSDSYSYSGPYSQSEPETQVMRYVFQAFHPDYYVNTHYGGNPILESDYGNYGQISYVFNRINVLSSQFGQNFPYYTKQGNWGDGYAVADAASFGANAFLFEVADETSPLYTTGDTYWHTAHSINDVQNYFFPKTLPILIAMAEASGGWTTPSNYYFTNTITGQTSVSVPAASPDPTPTPIIQQTYSQFQPSSAVGIWHFNEGSGNIAYDSSGSQNKATISNAGWTTGKSGGGLWFNPAIYPWVSVPSSSSLSGFSSGFTAEAWIQTNNIKGRETILSKYNSASGQMGWFIDINGNALEFFASQDGYSYVQAQTNFYPVSGTWYHIAVTWQPWQAPTFYINAQASPTTYTTGTIGSINNNAQTPLLIGTCQYDGSRAFDGAIDEVYIYNTAISAQQIAQDAGLSGSSGSSSSSGSAIFSDSFSSGNFNAWSGTAITPSEVLYVNSGFNSPAGTASAVFTTMGNGGYGGYEYAYAYKNIPAQSELYAQGYVYVMTSGIWQNNQRFFFTQFRSNGNSGNPIAYAGWCMVNGAVRWELLIRDGYGWATAYSTSSPSVQQWYSVDLHWRDSSSNGGADLYVDGQNVASISGVNTAAFGAVDTVLFGATEAYNTAHTAIYQSAFTTSTNYIP